MSKTTSNPNDLSLNEIVRRIESESGYRMLYRDALLAGKKARFTMDEEWKSEFEQILQSHGLTTRIDTVRKQMVIFKAGPGHSLFPDLNDAEKDFSLQGYVIDDKTGERLPYATIIWDQSVGQDYPEETHYQGTRTNLHGVFRVRVTRHPQITLRVSYVGYHPMEITLDTSELEQTNELAIRLHPAAYQGKEIVITGAQQNNLADTLQQQMLSIGTFNTLGESNSIRMLQTLPSVGQGMALADGAFIRGSSSDGLQVLLDGSVIYNQSHLFGLVDSFNADAIRISSFYYDVTPARFQSPPGGTLQLITRTGSLHDFRGNVGLSSSSVSGSVDGPLIPGQASWLLSGRASLLGTVDWFQTRDMVAWGLDIDRKNSLSEDIHVLRDRIVTPGAHEVHFHDLHGKVFQEDRFRNRWVLSGYSGYNNTSQNADRLVANTTGVRNERFSTQTFETANRWGNNSANLGLFRSLSNDWILEARSGISYYHTRFLKEDFSYQRPGQTPQQQMLIINEFENQSELTHWHGSANFQFTPANARTESIRIGAEIHGYRAAYLEYSLNHPGFFLRTTPLLIETYGESEWQLLQRPSSSVRIADIFTGARLQYYSDGQYMRLSPRLRTKLFPESTVSMGFGSL